MALTKEESIRLVKRLISLQLRDATHRHLFTMHGIRGQIAHDRLMRIARQSLVETAFDTEAHRDILEYEAQIPTQVFFDRVNIAGWVSLKKDVFYETDSEWKARAVPTMPSASDITNEQVHELLGYSGGGGEGSDNPFPESHDLSVADRRLQQTCEWALTEYPKASIHTYGNQGTTNDDRYLRRSASVFKGLVYHTIWLALNPANLTDTKWELLKKNMRTWHDFAKHFAAHATGNDPNVHAGTVYGVDNTFYDGSTVWIWNEVQPRTVLRARVTSDAIDSAINDLPTEALPEYGLPSDHYTVKEILGLRQPFDVHVATLSELSFLDQDDNTIALTPEFSPDITDYTLEIPAQTILLTQAVPTYEHANAVIFTNTPLTKITVAVESQDQESTETYTIAITETEEE